MGNKEKNQSKKVSKGLKKKGNRNSRKRGAKKLRRHEDSYSESDDESLCSFSSSSYSYGSQEGVLKGRRSKSRAKKDVKGCKKRARSSSRSSNSNSNSNSNSSTDSVRVNRRKSSRKKVGLGQKKKVGKKYRRASSLSSTSSDDTDYEKHRGELKKKKGTHRRYDKEEKSKRKRKRNRARSISPSSESSASDNETKRKRYRSASYSSSSASSESGKEGIRKKYWSPSGSSLSGGSKSSDQRVQYEIEVQNKPIWKLNSIIVASKSAEPDKKSMSERLNNDLDMRDDERSTKATVEKGENIQVEKSAAESTALVPDDENLESILRRKALENLKRFRGRPKTSEKSEKMEMSVIWKKRLPNSENFADQENTGGSGMKHSLSSEIVPFQNESDKDGVPCVNLVSSSVKEGVLAAPCVYNINTSIKNNVETKTGGTKYVQCSEDNRVMTPKADNLNPPTIEGNSSNCGHCCVSRHNLISQPGNSSNVKAESDRLLLSQEPLATCPIKGPKSSPQECINATSVPSNCSTDTSSNTRINEVNPKNVGDVIKESNIVDALVPDNPSSPLPDIMAGEHASSENQKENKEDSQFQEKTMTAIRGGELVWVCNKISGYR